ncbi:Predicted transcriptional regulator, ArsR family [Quadrisphaera sp. DSM 44207]|nr:Predicted transcriptional regulator, ArsR family [Quadrisphaera sp. DSM 44207]
MDGESRTRRRVLSAVLTRGPVTAGALADALGLTPAAVRRHLDALTADGLVAAHDLVRTGGRGRPARTVTATAAGRAAVRPRGGAGAGEELAAAALHRLAALGGREAVTAFAEDRARALEVRCAPALAAAGPGLAERVDALAGALSHEGYAASTRPVVPPRASAARRAPGRAPGRPAGRAPSAAGAVHAVQLCQGACPVAHVAGEFPELCRAETDAFSRLLGVHVQRLATLAHGEHACTTHVPVASPRSGTSTTRATSRTSTSPTSTSRQTPRTTASPEGTHPA